jgi:hypothetical protein
VNWYNKREASSPNLHRLRLTLPSRGGFSDSQWLCCSTFGASVQHSGQNLFTFQVIYHMPLVHFGGLLVTCYALSREMYRENQAEQASTKPPKWTRGIKLRVSQELRSKNGAFLAQPDAILFVAANRPFSSLSGSCKRSFSHRCEKLEGLLDTFSVFACLKKEMRLTPTLLFKPLSSLQEGKILF